MDIGGYTNIYKDTDAFSKDWWGDAQFKYPIQFGLTLCVLLPLCMIKDIGKLRLASFLGVISLIVLYIVFFVEAPWYIIDYFTKIYDKDNVATHLNITNVNIGFGSNLAFFKGSATLFYGFAAHYSAFPIIKVLHNPTYPRQRKVFFRAIIICGGLYLLVGIVGYLSVPYKTPDLIIERYNLLFEPDVFMTVGRALFVVALAFKIPANYNSLRISLLEIIYGTSEVNTTK